MPSVMRSCSTSGTQFTEKTNEPSALRCSGLFHGVVLPGWCAVNWIRRAALRFLAPTIHRLVESAGGSIERLAFQVQTLRAREAMRRETIQSTNADLIEAIALAGGPAWQTAPS